MLLAMSNLLIRLSIILADADLGTWILNAHVQVITTYYQVQHFRHQSPHTGMFICTCKTQYSITMRASLGVELLAKG